jgi:16S rRNA (uracil1498-N3)-methyltransferase
MSRPPRFAIETAPGAEAIVRVGRAESHHMRDVARLRAGDPVTLIDPSGAQYAGTIERFDRAGAIVKISAAEKPRARPRLILAAALIKGPRMDFLVEKAAELGATELWPVACQRSQVRAPGAGRVARWARLALAGAKQSLAAPAMTVRDPLEFADLIRLAPRDTLALICTEGAEPAGSILNRQERRSVLIACGPEGDFAPQERAAAHDAGFIAAGLGHHRLRTETAALAALAIAAEWLARP